MMRPAARPTLLHFLIFTLCVCFGASICRAQSASADSIQAAKLVANRSGWLLANNRLFWTDSLGVEWTEITPAAEHGTTLGGAFFSADGKGWVVQSGADGTALTVARTADEGAHWSYAAVASPFNEVAVYSGTAHPYFVDSQHGWITLSLQSGSAFRRGLLLRTVDGGVHWTQMPAPPVGADLIFTDAMHGWTGPGPNGTELFQTLDGGETWHASTLPVPSTELAQVNSSITLPTFTDSAHATLLRTYVGDQGTTVVRYDSSDGGTSWQPSLLAPATNSSFSAVAADGTLIHNLSATAKAGLMSATPAAGALVAVHASFSTPSNGWVVFSSGLCQQGVCTQTKSLMGTRDGGRTYFSLGQISGLNLESTSETALPSKSPSSDDARGLHPNSSYPIVDVMGFDACTLPTVAQMQTWWTSSIYKTAGVYIGGAAFACRSGLGSLTSSYVSSVLAQGWEIVPIWVGPQGPGSGVTPLVSTDLPTANAQGITEADSAVAAMTAIGMGQGSTIIYDMEAYSYTVTANQAITQAFLDGWNSELHAKGYLAGVYSGHNEFDTWTPTTVTPAIDTIWFTYFFSSGVPCGAQCQTVYPTTIDLPANYWLNHHRSRQTSSGFDVTYGGLKLNIDEDYTDAAFSVAQSVVLTAAKGGTGTGTIATATINNSLDTSIDTAISCTAACPSATANFAPTDTVTLMATPAAGSVFTSWSGCTSISGNTCTVTTTAATTVTATFTAATTYTLTVAKAGAGTGTVKSSDNYISCGTTCTAPYPTGTSVTLVATPAVGSVFGSWSGCTSTSGATCTVTTGSAAATITATFTPPLTFTAALSATTLSIVGGQSATDTLTITPQNGYVGSFTALSCSGLPSTATCAFSPTTLTATGNGAALTSTLTITTTPVFSASVRQRSTVLFACLFFPALLMPWAFRRRKTVIGRGLVLLVLTAATLGGSQLLSGCSAGDPAPYSTVPPGAPFSGTINVTFTSAAGTTSLPIQLSIAAK